MTTTWTPAPQSAPAPPVWDAAPGWVPPATARSSTKLDRSSITLHVAPIAVGLTLLALISLVGWLATKSEAQMAIGMALIAGLVLDGVVARRALSRFRVRLHGPRDTLAGEPVSWVLGVDGYRRPVALQLTWLPRPRKLLVTSEEPGLIHLPPGSRGVVHWLIIDATASGPLGLFEAGRRMRVRPEAPVYIGPQASSTVVRWPTPRAMGFGFSESAPIGDDLFRSIRPYVRGDEFRRIHWKSTARHGELMVRESDGTGVVAIQIQVDLGPPGPAAEPVASTAAWVAEEAIRRGWLVQLVTLDAGATEPPSMPLGKPFGPPPVSPPPVPVPLRTTSQRVRSSEAVRRQIATAAFGTPIPPPWKGMVCRVDRQGISWP